VFIENLEKRSWKSPSNFVILI